MPGERGKAAINASSTSLQLLLTLVSELASETNDSESESAAGGAVDVDGIAPSLTSDRFDVMDAVDVDGIAPSSTSVRFDVMDAVDVNGIAPSSTSARFDVMDAVDVDGIAPSSTNTALRLVDAGS